jgi:hypothetical protein
MESRGLYPAKKCYDCGYPLGICDEIRLPEGTMQLDESSFRQMVSRIKAWEIRV